MVKENKILLCTNLILFIILTAGFATVSIVNNLSNFGTFRKNIEHVSRLTSENIYNQFNSYFIQPVSVSMTMANDSLLKRFLTEETERQEDKEYLNRLQGYLNAYKEQYGFHSVFLVSVPTNRYYRHSGLDRVLTPDNPENQWYYSFLDSEEKYTLDVDQDESQFANRAITIFVNCKIHDVDGKVMGVVGVGLNVGNVEGLLTSHKEEYGVRTMFVDDTGAAVLSSEHRGNDLTSGLFDNFEYIDDSNITSVIGKAGADKNQFWVKGQQGDCFVVSQYFPAIQWHLILESDISDIERQFRKQICWGVGVTAFIVLSVLVIVSRVLSRNNHLLKMAVSQDLEYYTLIKKATEEMYEDVYEFDITHGLAVGEETIQYFQTLGLSPDADFDRAMTVIAEQQMKAEYRKDFLAVIAQKKVLEAFDNGIRELTYDAMMNTHWEDYHWVSIKARLFFWNADKSVHMIAYSKDIHDEKERENRLLQESMTDPLTGLYNRRYMEVQLGKLIKTLSRVKGILSILMIDIDFFKKYNDTYGHTAGDACIKKVAEMLREMARREDDFVVRYGGEEFVAILPGSDEQGAYVIAQKLLQCMIDCAIPHKKGLETHCVTISIGGVTAKAEHIHSTEEYIKCADEALYASKSNGRNRYTGRAFQTNKK